MALLLTVPPPFFPDGRRATLRDFDLGFRRVVFFLAVVFRFAGFRAFEGFFAFFLLRNCPFFGPERCRGGIRRFDLAFFFFLDLPFFGFAV